MSTSQKNDDGLMAGLPRWADLVIGVVLTVPSLPVMVVLATITFFDMGTPVIYRQKRVGRCGNLFTLFKFRTMTEEAPGPAITASSDDRITRTGRWMRKFKLDELPEIINVLRGDMAMVGPRPEVPRFVDLEDELWQSILRVRPGVTDPATIKFWDEEQLLATEFGNVEHYYATDVLPKKLELQYQYLTKRSWRTDLSVLASTASIFFRSFTRAKPL
ncbi:sugar transferase [Gammaproteobacteria bacterium]|nr:sugar transferase [Gammaproteobacteria bacterium]